MVQPSGLRALEQRDRLAQRLATGRLRPRHLRAIGHALAQLHAASERASEEQGAPGPARLARRWREGLHHLVAEGALLPEEQVRLEEGVGATVTRGIDRLLARHDAGRVRRIHGSLSGEKLRVRRRRAVFDPAATEVWGDTSMDLAALSGEIRAEGHCDLAEQLLAAYALASDDYPLYGVIDFHECLCVVEAARGRGREETLRLLHPWLDTDLPREPTLILLTGGVASGKSTLAKALAHRLAAARVVGDRVREAVLGPIAELAGPEAVIERAWSKAFDERVWGAVLERAGQVLRSDRSCVIDACAPTRRFRERAAELVVDCGAELVVCTCLAAPLRVRERLARRDDRDGVPPGSWERIAEELRSRQEPVEPTEPGRQVSVRTDAPVADGVAAVMAVLGPLRPARPLSWGRADRPQAVTFDCWMTLIQEEDWGEAHRLRVEALHAATVEDRAEQDLATVAAAFDRAWLRHMELWREGIHSGAREVARWCLEALGLPLAEPVVQHLTERFQVASHSGRVVALEGARETLERLYEAGVRLALVCDTGLTPGWVVRQHLDRLHLLAPLTAQLFSDEIGTPKPDPRIFRAALAALGATPGETIHVGDLLRTDVAGARALGMGSVRLRAAHDDDTRLPEADAVVDSHAQLRILLGLD